MGSKLSPGTFDCYANAEPDEPMFVLLARDASAPDIVDVWARTRENMIATGLKPESDRKMVLEAQQCAIAMHQWRARRRP